VTTRLRLAIAVIAPLAVIGLATPAAVAAPAPHHINLPLNHGLSHSTSGNWAGYAVTGGKFTSVSASWVQPAVKATSQDAYSSFWVGIDGDGSNSVEQLGTEVDYINGQAEYYAWYEMYPAYPVNFSDTVRPGDHFTASVTEATGGKFTLKIADTTRGWSHTVSKTYSAAKLASAEIIAEAPSDSNGTLPLADFGSVSFTNATANGKAIGSQNADPITQASGGVTKDAVSGLSGGNAFTCTWKHV
jgi:hypothetical protein